jgi:hypothetical protein
MKTFWVYFAKEAQGDENPDLIIFETVAVQKQLIVFQSERSSCPSTRQLPLTLEH